MPSAVMVAIVAALTVELISEVGMPADAILRDMTVASEPADCTTPRLASNFQPLAS